MIAWKLSNTTICIPCTKKHPGTFKTPPNKWEYPYSSQNSHWFPLSWALRNSGLCPYFASLYFRCESWEALHSVGMQRVLCKSWKNSGSEVEGLNLIQAEQGSGSRFLQPDLIGIWLCIICSGNPGSLGAFLCWFCPGPMNAFLLICCIFSCGNF